MVTHPPVSLVMSSILHAKCQDHVKIMARVTILILYQLDILVHVYLTSKALNVNMIIDHANQILVGIMVHLFIFI